MRPQYVPIPRVIGSVTALIVSVGIAAAALWMATGEIRWVILFFHYPGALLLVGLSATELWLAGLARRQFSPGDVLRPAWTLILLAAACHCSGELLVQGSGENLPGMRHIGLSIGGPIRMAFLAVGLAIVVRTYRRSGLLPRLALVDHAAIVLVTFFAARQLYEAWQNRGLPDSLYDALTWATDPLIAVLLTQAIALRRAVINTGWGLIAKCWGALATGIFLTSLGDVGLWGVGHGFPPWPWSATTWYVWFLASAAFAMAPAYQVETARRAVRSVRMRAAPSAVIGLAGLSPQ